MTRTERDSMGEMSLPDDVYYGIQTARAIDNFKISGLKPLPTFVDACLLIKKATALVNAELGCIPIGMGMAIAAAADEILDGQLRADGRTLVELKLKHESTLLLGLH